MDHDFSLLVPEVWGRMRREEQVCFQHVWSLLSVDCLTGLMQDANYLIQHGYLEKVPDLQVSATLISEEPKFLLFSSFLIIATLIS